MSFLDKLGDFGGGFAEGATEAFQPAFQRGWERGTELVDLAEKREYQETVRAEGRVYAKEMTDEQREYQGRLRLLNELGQTRDLQGLADEFGEDDPLYTEAQTKIGFIVNNIKEKSEQSFRVAKVALDLSKDLQGKNYRQLQVSGADEKTFQDIIIQLQTTKENILAVMEDPNFSYGADESTVAAYKERLEDIKTRLEKINEHNSGYTTYLLGRESYDQSIDIAIENENYDYAIELMNKQGGKYYEPSVQQSLIMGARRKQVLKHLRIGDTAAAYTAAGDSVTLKDIISDHDSIQAGEITTLSIDAAPDYVTLMGVYENLLESPNIGEAKRELLMTSIKNKFGTMAIESKPLVSAAILKLAKTVMIQGGVSIEKAMRTAWNSVEKNPTWYGVEKWMVDRLEWDRSLAQQYGDSTANNLPDRMSKQYVDLIDSGAYGKDEVLGFLGKIEFLSPWERDRVAQTIHTHEPKFTESAMMGFGGPLNVFELTDLPGFSHLDEMQVKAMAKNAAVATQGKRAALQKLIKDDITNAMPDTEHRAEALRRVDVLFDSLKENWPDLSYIEEEEIEKERFEKRARHIRVGGGASKSGGGNTLTGKSLDHIQGVKTRPSNVQPVTTI
jgi:hypothetical protein